MRVLPQLPANTCPDIDDVIKILEELREANAALRAHYEYQMKRADALELEVGEEASRADHAEDEVAGLRAEVFELTQNGNGGDI